MKGRINKYFTDRGFGFLIVEGREKDVYFRADHTSERQRSLLAEGLWAEFDLGPSPRGDEMAVNVRLLLDEDIAPDDWACLLVDEAGNWSSTTTDEDRAIVAAFLPSAKTLSELVRHQGALLKSFHASETGSARARQFEQMGQITQSLIGAQKAAFAVGRIPAVRWPGVGSMGASLWAAMIARLAAVYLPFVRGRAWVAVEDRIVTPDLWNFYRHELRGRFMDACYMLKRPDRARLDTWLRLCIYAKKQGAVTHYEGQLTAEEGGAFAATYHWYPDAGKDNSIPLDHVRCGISLPDFVGNVMVSGSNRDAQQWREKLRGKVCEVDLTEFRL